MLAFRADVPSVLFTLQLYLTGDSSKFRGVFAASLLAFRTAAASADLCFMFCVASSLLHVLRGFMFCVGGMRSAG